VKTYKNENRALNTEHGTLYWLMPGASQPQPQELEYTRVEHLGSPNMATFKETRLAPLAPETSYDFPRKESPVVGWLTQLIWIACRMFLDERLFFFPLPPSEAGLGHPKPGMACQVAIIVE
jgi:hypothetical protein